MPATALAAIATLQMVLRGEDEVPFFREVAVAWVQSKLFQTGHMRCAVIRVVHLVCRYNARPMPSVQS